MIRISFENQQVVESEHSKVTSEDPSYHAIKVFNMVEDALWDQLDLLGNAMTTESMIHITKEVRVLLLRADKVWSEIKKAVEVQAAGLKIKATSFSYNGEFSMYAAQLLNYVKVALNANFLASNGSPEEQANAVHYLEQSPQERMNWLIEKVENTILDSTERWGELAAEINFTMPINIKDTRDPFL